MLTLPIGLDPVAFSPGGVEVRWHCIAVAASLLLAVSLAAGRPTARG